MEDTSMDISGGSEEGSGAGTTASSRWNPTKEQIGVLEGLYKQGIRTPSAEQIQQITSRLRAYGHIEGKNVFYWFQNHKARQRQKQKQESMLYINRFLHSTATVLPPCTNVLCRPFCAPQGGVGFYPELQKVFLPGGVRRKSRGETMRKIQDSGLDGNKSEPFQTDNSCPNCEFHETLQLFPLHPTGFLQGRTENCFASSSSHAGAVVDGSGNFNSETNMGENGRQPFFNFFADQGE